LEQYEAGRAIFQKLMDTFPPNVLPRTRNELSNILTNIAEIERMQGRLAEARANCDKALLIRESLVRDYPQVLGYRIRLGECRLRSGQVRLAAADIPGAVADWRRALEVYEGLPLNTGETAMFQAGCHVMLSVIAGVKDSGLPVTERSAEAEKAMAILRRTVAEGFRDPQLANESSLDPLRNRIDFRTLMLDVVFPTKPFAP
jgi:tetratricopeptide (TPR) repeat protein